MTARGWRAAADRDSSIFFGPPNGRPKSRNDHPTFLLPRADLIRALYFVFASENRGFCFQFVESNWGNQAVLFFIFLNTITLAMYDPFDVPGQI